MNRRGATEYTFNATEFKNRITKEGLKQLGGEYSNDYKGRYQGHPVTIKYGGATASANRWEQHWDVAVD
ncbi:hypothetical protein [Hymenobacter sp. YC55]|uniref:hypothetical protein n=1 Tax=Hymenobacter sp. YC55 TaxID=3034019 RepID=UPI0023F97AE7|nr:hypothetical protein [Hymenobacter sp. YC55]MDF7815383.1 hypothetical protein [Hymenobacter sp. YC55]